MAIDKPASEIGAARAAAQAQPATREQAERMKAEQARERAAQARRLERDLAGQEKD